MQGTKNNFDNFAGYDKLLGGMIDKLLGGMIGGMHPPRIPPQKLLGGMHPPRDLRPCLMVSPNLHLIKLFSRYKKFIKRKNFTLQLRNKYLHAPTTVQRNHQI